MSNATYINTNKGRISATVVSLQDKVTHYAGGGNPFSVESVDVEFIIHAERRDYHRTDTGYRQPCGKIGFYGGCADSGISTYLEVAND